MTRYDELAVRAVSAANRINNLEIQCQLKAYQIILRWIAFLECPPERVSVALLDERVEFNGKMTALNPRVEMVHAADGRWYFGIHTKYQTPGAMAFISEAMPVGIEPIDDKVSEFKIGLYGDHQFLVKTDEDLVRFFEHLFTSTESRLAAGFSKRTQQAIGFLNDDK